MRRTQRAPPSVESADLQHDPEHQDHDAGGDPERDGLLERDEEELHGSLSRSAVMDARDASRWDLGPIGRTAGYDDGVTPFDRLGRFVARRARWVVGAWALVVLAALPLAPQVPGRLSAGGFILDDLESARAKALLGRELDAPPSALVIVFDSPTLEAGTPAFEVAGGGGRRGHRRRAARRAGRLASRRAAAGLGRSPHGLRHRLPRPATRRFARRRSRSCASACTRRRA